MEVLVAKSAGFCFGVKNAVKTAYSNVNKNKVVTFGPIIHNKYVINDLENKGIKSVENLNNIKDETVLIRSHGIGPEIYNYMNKNNINYIDCTCPYVKKIHKYVKDKFELNYKIIIIGDKNHPEIIGINGYCNNTAIIIKTPEEVTEIDFNKNEKYIIVVQTTFRKAIFDKIIEEINKKVSNVEIYNTICNATSTRQQETEKISKLVDVMIVLGDKKSSNTSKLYEISKKNCEKTFLLESINELQLNNFNTNDKIGITAGASTPPDIIKEAIYKMSNIDTKDNQTFEQMLDESLITLHTGSIVKGTIAQILNGEILVSFGYKSDGIINHNQISNDPNFDINKEYKVGNEIEAYVLRVNDGEGNVLLSTKKIEYKKGLDSLEEAFNNKTTVRGKITEAIKGGFISNINGVRVFIPSSHISNKFESDTEKFIGKEFDFKIIEFDKYKKKIVGSRKVILKEKELEDKSKAIENISIGDKLNGNVSNITDFGAFVDLGGIEGLIHISELSWGKVKKVTDVVNIGDNVDVVVLDVDKDNLKVKLSLKQANGNLWDNIEDRYPIGSDIDVKIVRFATFGAFAELEPGLDGLLHISQISRSHVKKVEDVLKIGDVIKVRITDIDKDNKKISLSKKALEDSMVTEVHEPNAEINGNHFDETIAEDVIDEVPNNSLDPKGQKI